MAFNIPKDRFGFFKDIDHRFRLLLDKDIVTGIDKIRLNGWLANFKTLEDKYLAAHLLNGLTYCSDAIVSVPPVRRIAAAAQPHVFGVQPLLPAVM